MHEATAVALQPVGEKGRVLLMSRDHELEQTLKTQYFQVERVETAEAMQQHAITHRYDLLLVDTRLGFTAEAGFEAQIRATAGDSPVLYLTEPPETALDSLTLEAVEKKHIARVLGLTHGNFAKSARILGIDRTTLYNKVRRYGLSRN